MTQVSSQFAKSRPVSSFWFGCAGMVAHVADIVQPCVAHVGEQSDLPGRLQQARVIDSGQVIDRLQRLAYVVVLDGDVEKVGQVEAGDSASELADGLIPQVIQCSVEQLGCGGGDHLADVPGTGTLSSVESVDRVTNVGEHAVPLCHFHEHPVIGQPGGGELVKDYGLESLKVCAHGRRPRHRRGDSLEL